MEEDRGHGKKLTPEELDRELAAGEELDEGEEEEELEEELDEESAKIYEGITKDNMRSHLAEATAFKMAHNYEKACLILKMLIRKGEQLYGDPLHPELASYYYMMGDFLMEEIEDEGEIAKPQPTAEPDQMVEGLGMAQSKPIASDPMDPGVDPEVIQSAWENLETARHILQKKLDEGHYAGEEEKASLISKLAIVNLRVGDCECWQDKFKEAIDAYSHALSLREHIESPKTSRGIAEIYFMLANATAYLNERLPGCSPIDYLSKAGNIFEQILVEKYEKKGINVLLDASQQTQKALLKPRQDDDEGIKEVKAILGDLYQRMEDCKLEEEARRQYDATKKKEEEENKQALNAFGKPIVDSEEKKVKNLGSFGRFY